MKYFSLGGSSGNWVQGATILPKSTNYGNRTVTTCGSYTSPSGNHTWTVSGNYTDTIVYPAICDSIINIALTIVNNSTSNINAMGCNKYYSPSGKYKWTSSGTYQDIVPNHLGCDSLITINLIIQKIDTTVHNTANVFTSWLNNAKYQWLDCNNNYAKIIGETNQGFKATKNGSYAVEVSKNGCTDTSACHVLSRIGISEFTDDTYVKLFPNPATDVLNIKMYGIIKGDTKIKIFDLGGKKVYQSNYSQEELISIPINLKAGIYFLNIQSKVFNTTRKLMVN